ncbi:MAG: methyltransferase [Actinomycetota bacterium]
MPTQPGQPGNNPAPDLQELGDLATPWCLRVVVTLRIAELLDGQGGSADATTLAQAASCNPAALAAALGHLVTKGVFTSPGPDRFGLNDAARQLLHPAAHLGFDLDGIGGRMSYAWGTLPIYVRTGRSGYDQLNGLGFWDDLAAHPDVAAGFDDLMGMVGHGTPVPPPIAGGWAATGSVADVGGGTGAMLAEILKEHRGLRGTLIDLPGTIARAGPTFEQAGVADRVQLVAQSFFDPLPPGAGAYLLCKVLNDWPDAETVAILRRCAEAAAPSGGRVLVSGGVVADGSTPTMAIDMVVAGGRSVPLDEFRRQAAEAGLAVNAVHEDRGGNLVVECQPSR